MARKKTKAVAENAAGALEKMQTVAAYVAACSDKGLIDAFGKLSLGDKLFTIFVNAVNEEVEGFFNQSTEEAADGLTEQVVSLSGAIDELEQQVKGLSNERLFQVLGVVLRNFGGAILPPPQQTPPQAAPTPAPPQAPAVEATAKSSSKKTTLRRRFAASSTREAQQAAPEPTPAPAAPPPQPVSADRPAAPTRPPRGSNIPGFF